MFQDPNLQSDSSEYHHREEAAQFFATYCAHKLFGAPGMQRKGPLSYTNRPRASGDLAGSYGKGHWRRRQFTTYP